MHVLLRAAAAIALATSFAVPAPAHAASLCYENNQLTFTPPLNTGNQFGTAVVSYQGLCADAPGLAPRTVYTGSVTAGYFGSCAVALIAEGGQSVIVGGTLYAFVRNNDAKVAIMQPNNACPIASAHGTAVRPTFP